MAGGKANPLRDAQVVTGLSSELQKAVFRRGGNRPRTDKGGKVQGKASFRGFHLCVSMATCSDNDGPWFSQQRGHPFGRVFFLSMDISPKGCSVVSAGCQQSPGWRTGMRTGDLHVQLQPEVGDGTGRTGLPTGPSSGTQKGYWVPRTFEVTRVTP